MELRSALLVAAVCVPAWAHALPAAPAKPAAEPDVKRIVIEDKDTRIDELRVRGQTTHITVTSKVGGGTRYEIIPADGLRDLPDAGGTTQGAAGKRVWHVLNF